MFKIYRYVHSNNRLHLSQTPIGLIWMNNKIANVEIEHKSLSIDQIYGTYDCATASGIACLWLGRKRYGLTPTRIRARKEKPAGISGRWATDRRLVDLEYVACSRAV